MRSFAQCRITPPSFRSSSNFSSRRAFNTTNKVTYDFSHKLSLLGNRTSQLFTNRTFSTVHRNSNSASAKRNEKYKENQTDVNNLLFRKPLATLLQQRRFDDALEFLNSITRGGVCDVMCYNAMINAYLSQDPPALDSAIQLFNKMDKLLIKPNETTYNILLELLTKNNHVEQVMSLVSSMVAQEIYPDETTFQLLINMYASMKDTEEVLFYYGSLSRCGIKPSTEITSQVLSYLINQHDIENAYQLFKFTTNIPDKMLLDAGLMTMLLNFFTDSEEWAKVEEVLEVIGQQSQKSKPSKLKPDTKLYRAISNYYRERGDATSALHLLKANVNLDLPTLTILISLFSKSNDIDSVDYCLEYATKSGLKGDTHFYNALLAAYVRNKRNDKGEDLLRLMRDTDVTLDNITVTLLVELLHDRLEILYDIALSQLESPSVKMDSILCNTLLGAFSKSPDADQMWELYCKIKEKEEQNPDFRVLDAKSYFIVCEGIARSGKTDRIPLMAADVANSNNMSVMMNVQTYDQYCWMLSHLTGGNLKQGLLCLTELAKLRQWTYKICEDFLWWIICYKDKFLFTTQSPQTFHKISQMKNTFKLIQNKHKPIEGAHKEAFETLCKELIGTLQ